MRKESSHHRYCHKPSAVMHFPDIVLTMVPLAASYTHSWFWCVGSLSSVWHVNNLLVCARAAACKYAISILVAASTYV